jgi:predicted RNA-binding Zn ribbon-like protein
MKEVKKMRESTTLIGGSPWVNLVNTAYISKGEKIDVLNDEREIIRWLLEDNIISQEDLANHKYIDLVMLKKKLVELRSICRELLVSIDKERKISAASLRQLNDFVNSMNLMFSFEILENEPVIFYSGQNLFDDVFYKITSSIADTFTRVTGDRVRGCEHEECVLFFVDTSKGGKRRWCSMESCGNRKKAAEFYARKIKR